MGYATNVEVYFHILPVVLMTQTISTINNKEENEMFTKIWFWIKFNKTIVQLILHNYSAVSLTKSKIVLRLRQWNMTVQSN